MYQIEGLGFIAHPNCASRSIRKALEKRGAIKYGHHHRFDLEVIERCEHVFCVLRNPFDIILSWYHRTQAGPGCMTFEDWVPYVLHGGEPRHFEGPGKLFYGFEHCDWWCKFENLQRDFDTVMRSAGLKTVGLNHIGKTKNKPKDYRPSYNQRTRTLIEHEYAEQLEMGCYVF